MSLSPVNTPFIERYQLILDKDPQSKVFAALAEAYRKMELLEEARAICQRGLRYNPEFSSGHVALANIYMDLENYEKALEAVQTALKLSPDNLLAHSLKANALLNLRRPKEALKAFKKVLFLNPHNEKAAQAVRKLESLTADEYEKDLFQKKSLTSKKEASSAQEPPPAFRNSLEGDLSMADAYTVRNELQEAQSTLRAAAARWGPHPEIDHRLKRLDEILSPSPQGVEVHQRQDKISLLKQWLQRIESHKAL